MHLSKTSEMLGNKLTGRLLVFSSLDFFLWTGLTPANFKTDRNWPEMTDSLKALDTKIENKLAFALTILVGTSLLCVAFLVSRDNISLKMVSDETRSNENVLLLSNVYARMVFVFLNSSFNRIVNI